MSVPPHVLGRQLWDQQHTMREISAELKKKLTTVNGWRTHFRWPPKRNKVQRSGDLRVRCQLCHVVFVSQSPTPEHCGRH